METRKPRTFKIFAVAVLISLVQYAECFEIQAGNDSELIKFLNSAMMNYTSWLTENHFDPSPTTNFTSILESQPMAKVKLHCKIRKHSLSGHSETTNDIVKANSSFLEHFAGIGREIRQSYAFRGDYNCTGTLNASQYEGLVEDLMFSGQGRFIITIDSSIEFITLMNIGITNDHKFNLTHSWPDYILNSTTKNVDIRGNWNENFNSSEYLLDLQEEFGLLHHRFLLADGKNLSNPSGQLILKYIREILGKLELRNILSEENLPEPYLPTPSTNTTTTEPATITATAPTTTSPSITTHQSTSPKPNDATSLLVKCWLIFMNAICVHYFKFE